MKKAKLGILLGFLILTVILILGYSPVRAAYGTEFSKTDYVTGNGAWGVESADFNGDGKLDLAVANSASNNVSILLGNGDGTFQAARNYGVGTYPTGITTGDFNGDGKGDLAVTNFYSDNVSILVGVGDGTFGAAVNYGTGESPYSVVTGDFNGDTRLDLAISEMYNNNISILLGDGNGTFKAPINNGVVSRPSYITMADYNGDGKLDIASANFDSNNAAVLLGKGDGTFQAAVYYGVGKNPWGITTGDFNGDGNYDLAVGNANSGNVSILLSQGNGTFGAAINYELYGGVTDLTTADFNGDGKLDLALDNTSRSNVGVLPGVGDGTFQAGQYFGVGGASYGITTADFNGDGKYDLAATSSASKNVSILLNTTYMPGALGFDQPAISANEDCGEAELTVKRQNVLDDGLVTVNYYTVDGSATAGSDYVSTAGTLTFAEGEDTKNIKIPVYNDARGEGDEVFTVNICDPGGGAYIGTIKTVEITIKDNDGSGTPGTIQFETTASSFDESRGDALINVVRTGGDSGQVSIDYYTMAGTAAANTDYDYDTSSGTLVFCDQQTSAVIRVPIIDDSLPEADETFKVCLTNPGGRVTLGNPKEMTVTILDDESRAPAEVIGLTLTSENGEIKAAWTDPASKNLGGVHLYIKPEGGEYGPAIAVDKGVQSYTFTGLVNGRTYIVKAATVSLLYLESSGVSTDAAPITDDYLPDLIVNSIKATGAMYPGGRLRVSFTVVNQGEAAAKRCKAEVYLLATEGDEPGNYVRQKAVLALKPGGDSKITGVAVTLPRDLTADNIYLLVVADSDNVIPETDDWNNRSIIVLPMQYPDLAFVAPPEITGALESGAKITVKDQVVNLGPAPARECEIAYYLWDGSDPASKVYLGKHRVVALKPGHIYKGRASLVVPSVAPGTWHLLGIIDEANQVREIDEGNNQASV